MFLLKPYLIFAFILGLSYFFLTKLLFNLSLQIKGKMDEADTPNDDRVWPYLDKKTNNVMFSTNAWGRWWTKEFNDCLGCVPHSRKNRSEGRYYFINPENDRRFIDYFNKLEIPYVTWEFFKANYKKNDQEVAKNIDPRISPFFRIKDLVFNVNPTFAQQENDQLK